MAQKIIVDSAQLYAEYLTEDDCYLDSLSGYLELHFHKGHDGKPKVKEVYSYFLNIDSNNPWRTFTDKVKVLNFGSELDNEMVKAVIKYFNGEPPEKFRVKMHKLVVKENKEQ